MGKVRMSLTASCGACVVMSVDSQLTGRRPPCRARLRSHGALHSKLSLTEVLKSCGTSSLEASAVAASREWIERCWLLWDRDKSGRISLKDFAADGGLADMMLQQSALAAAKRVVRRMELELHDPAALVACCQQLVECSVGIRPEDSEQDLSLRSLDLRLDVEIR